MQTNAVSPKIYYLSEHAVTLEFGTVIDDRLQQQITAFNALLNLKPFAGFKTSVPAYTTLSVFYDPVEVIQNEALSGNDCFEKVGNYLRQLLKEPLKYSKQSFAKITIPTCYGGVFGPDIEDVARMNRLTTSEVISLHSNAVYKVYMMGFAPGFAYLGGMDTRLTMPRKATPSHAIPPGSVAIAGRQTGIYPLQTPGGWQLIGKTPLRMFDATRPQPSLLKSGDQVVFKPIDQQEFEFLSHK